MATTGSIGEQIRALADEYYALTTESAFQGIQGSRCYFVDGVIPGGEAAGLAHMQQLLHEAKTRTGRWAADSEATAAFGTPGTHTAATVRQASWSSALGGRTQGTRYGDVGQAIDGEAGR